MYIISGSSGGSFVENGDSSWVDMAAVELVKEFSWVDTAGGSREYQRSALHLLY